MYLSKFAQIKYRHLFRKTYVRVTPGSKCTISPSARLKNSNIVILNHGELVIDDHTEINNACIVVDGGKVRIGRACKIGTINSTSKIHGIDSMLQFGNNVQFSNCMIIAKKSTLEVGNECKAGFSRFIANVNLTDTTCKIGDSTLIGLNESTTSIVCDNAIIKVGHHSKIAAKKVWVRFGGKLSVGDYTNINENSEIRCDDSITIGSFTRVSYNVRIWDTNTHQILSKDGRRKRTIDYFPIFSHELDRPTTKPVSIGSDCWIGEFCAILKGSKIGDQCILAFHTIIPGKEIPDNSTVFSKSNLTIVSKE